MKLLAHKIMPQISPMNWLILMFYFLFSYYLVMLKIYFFK